MERLVGVVQPYAWGSPTVIPELLGVEPTGDPQAELWFGAHPLAPSIAAGEPLDKIVDRDPETVVGAALGRRLRAPAALPAQDHRRRPAAVAAGPSRPDSRPRRAGRARRRRGCRATRRTGPTGTAGPSPRCCAPCARPRRCAGSAHPDETYALFGRLGVPQVMALLEPLADESVPAMERLCVVFGRLLRLEAADRPLVDAVLAAASGRGRTTTRTYRPSPGRRPRSGRSTPATRACWRRC